MEKNKEYYAFISYKREDEKWAKWLQDKLEHYKFPMNLNGRTDLPKNIRPTFRDVTDLNPGLLAEEINNALHNSEWLIVICSPRSAKSPWVCKEAQTFIDLGRADHIIPFVIEGYPFSNDTTTESYPEALLNLTDSKELLAANINEMGRDAAAIKIVARMFNLRFDTLWQRYEKEKRRKRIMTLLGTIAFAVLALGVAFWLWHLNKQIALANKNLVKENICVKSREVLTLLENGEYVEAKHQVNSILELWNKECQQEEIPEMEKALRALYRYQWKDGIVKLYSIPVSDRQSFLAADSNYLYIKDLTDGHEKIVGYAIATGDSAKQFFSLEGNDNNYTIYDFKQGLVLCHKERIPYYADDGTYMYPPDTICVFNQENGKKIIEKEGYYNGIILEKDRLLFSHYDRSSKTNTLELVHIYNNGITTKWNSLFDDVCNAASLINDSLFIIGESKAFVLNSKDGKLLDEIDYQNEKLEMESFSVGYQSINKLTKQFLDISRNRLRLFSTDRHQIKVLGKSDQFRSAAFNPTGNMLATVKQGIIQNNEKDSLLIYYNGIDFPLFSIEGDGVGDITFADDFILVENCFPNRINVYSCLADFYARPIYSSTGDYFAYLNKHTGGSIVICNDSTEETVCKINGSENKITNCFGFSPQDTYLIYSTEKNSLVLHHIKKDKDIIVPLLEEHLAYNKRDYYMSEDESRILSVVPSADNYADDIITLYDIEKNAEVLFSIKVTQEKLFFRMHYALNVNGSRMAFSDGGQINVIWSDSITKNGQSVVIKETENSSVRELRFLSGISEVIAASYSDGTIRFWNTISGEQVYGTIRTETDGVLNFDISSDSKYLVGTKNVGNNNWEYLVWHIPSGLLIDKETNEWCRWVNSINHFQLFQKPTFRAFFAKNSNDIIVNNYNLYGLSRKIVFLSFDELVDLYLKKE